MVVEESKKVAFITGSGKRRLGRAVALEAGRRGYDVAVHYNGSRDEAEETVSVLRELGVRAESFAANLKKPEECVELCKRVIAFFGRVDLLVTCASIWKPKPLAETSIEDLVENFNVNALSTFLCCQHIGLCMSAQASGGSIVTMGDWALSRPYENYSAYFLSKGCIPSLTLSLANEFSAINPKVRINCINPGPGMIPESVPETDRIKVINRSLTKSLGSPQHIVQAVFALTENEYLTGTCLNVDGGRSVSNR